MNTIFLELGVIVTIATICALLARLFRQPPLLGYILTGILLGPIGAHFIHNQDLLVTLRSVGVAVLLFLVGLELDWGKVRHQLSNTFITSVLQIFVSFAIGFALARAVYLPPETAIFIGFALAFSSSVIVVKLLGESRDLSSLHGRLSIGILLFQDLIAIFGTVLLSGIDSGDSGSTMLFISLIILKTAALFGVLWILSRYFLPHLFSRIAHSTELLFMASLAWCFLVTFLVYQYGFPIEVGAFLAGVSLAPLSYSLDTINRLRSLRDLFVILLFISLGSSLQLPTASLLTVSIALLLLTLIFRPIVTFAVLIQRGYKSRTAFLAALTQGQLSEFTLILVGEGLGEHLIDSNVANTLIFTAVASLFFSTILISQRERLYRMLRGYLRKLEHHHRFLAPDVEAGLDNHIIIFGYHRMGYHILTKLRELPHQVVVVDFNPDIIKMLRRQEVEAVYGDIQDEDILEQLHAERAKMVISTVPHKEETIYLIEEMKKLNSEALVIVTSHFIDDALQYYNLGASYVILPHLLGGEYVANLITQYEQHALVRLIRHRAEEIKLLRTKNHSLYFE
ncbi:cation:proton antiporter [Patescibacteria group bacterium]|nr:cation:proton antiporter [Patescibacteria group bacterium]